MGAGLALVLVAAGDAVSTLVTTRRRRSPFRGVYQRLATFGVTLPPYEQAWADYRRLRVD